MKGALFKKDYEDYEDYEEYKGKLAPRSSYISSFILVAKIFGYF